MPRDYKVYLQDILEAIQKIRKYTSGLALQSFREDTKTIDAVVRNLEIIGEGAKNVPDFIRSQHQEVEWKKISGLRNILIHEYFGINVEILWDIVQNKLNDLEKCAQNILNE